MITSRDGVAIHCLLIEATAEVVRELGAFLDATGAGDAG